MMIRSLIHLTRIALFAPLWGCVSPNDVLCTAIAVPGINVLVRDSASGSFASDGATATAVDGGYTDTNGFPEGFAQPETPISLAYEREGTYAVTVTRAGYRAWTTSGVHVSRDVCHVRTVTFTARLQH